MFVYIASAYTIGDVALNVRVNIDAANQVAKAGHIPYAPLLSHFWHMNYFHEHEFWLQLGKAWVERCDAVIRLPGPSRGADIEVEYAYKLGKRVYYSVEDFVKANVGAEHALLLPCREQ